MASLHYTFHFIKPNLPKTHTPLTKGDLERTVFLQCQERKKKIYTYLYMYARTSLQNIVRKGGRICSILVKTKIALNHLNQNLTTPKIGTIIINNIPPFICRGNKEAAL